MKACLITAISFFFDWVDPSHFCTTFLICQLYAIFAFPVPAMVFHDGLITRLHSARHVASHFAIAATDEKDDQGFPVSDSLLYILPGRSLDCE